MIYFLTSQIPQLKAYSTKERLGLITQALEKLTTLERTVLNVIKLLLITPIFFILAKIDGWQMLPWLLLVGIGYPIITLPIRHYFALRHLNAVLKAQKKDSE